MELSALKVKIKRANNRAKYPDFNSLQVVSDSGMDWSSYVDVNGRGWIYDKVSGHDDDSQDSPSGEQLGVLLVPEAFADQAAAAFEECTKMTEAELETFHDTKGTVYEDADKRDIDLLQALHSEFKILKDLTTEFSGNTKLQTRMTDLKQKLIKALDPTDDSPGVRLNKMKLWADRKIKQGITIRE